MSKTIVVDPGEDALVFASKILAKEGGVQPAIAIALIDIARSQRELVELQKARDEHAMRRDAAQLEMQKTALDEQFRINREEDERLKRDEEFRRQETEEQRKHEAAIREKLDRQTKISAGLAGISIEPPPPVDSWKDGDCAKCGRPNRHHLFLSVDDLECVYRER